MEENTLQDIQLLNILVNNKKELRDFISHSNEELFNPQLRRFVKHLFSYFHSYNSCPSLLTLTESCTNGTNSNLDDYLRRVWGDIEDQYTDPREYTFILDKLKERRNFSLLDTIKERIEATLAQASDDMDASVLLDSINREVSRVVNEIHSMGAKRVYSESSLRNAVEDYVARFKAKQANPDLSKGILTKFSIFDYYTNGLRPAELGIVAADTGGGKSIFLIDLAVNVWMGENKVPESIKEMNQLIASKDWKPGNDVLFISLEMPKEEIEDRIISCMCGINSLDLMKGKLTGGEPEKLTIGLKFWQNCPGNFKIVDVPRGCSMAQIQAIFDDVCLEFKPKMVIIDYLGLMTDDGESSDADWEKLKNVAEQMHEFARVNEVAVFTGVQVKCSKPGEGGVGLHRIGRSSMIMHNANIALQIENRENEEMRPDSIIHCIKFRRGPKFVMNNLRKEFMYTRFADTGMVNNEPEKEVGKFGEDLSGLMGAILQDAEEEETQESDS